MDVAKLLPRGYYTPWIYSLQPKLMSISYNPGHNTTYPSSYKKHPNFETLYLLPLYNKLVD